AVAAGCTPLAAGGPVGDHGAVRHGEGRGSTGSIVPVADAAAQAVAAHVAVPARRLVGCHGTISKRQGRGGPQDRIELAVEDAAAPAIAAVAALGPGASCRLVEREEHVLERGGPAPF